MEKYTAIYVANGRYDSGIDEPRSRVEYIQGKDLDVIIKGHVEQVDIGHGIGHQMLTDEDVIITGVNNGQHFDRYIEIGMRK